MRRWHAERQRWLRGLLYDGKSSRRVKKKFHIHSMLSLRQSSRKQIAHLQWWLLKSSYQDTPLQWRYQKVMSPNRLQQTALLLLNDLYCDIKSFKHEVMSFRLIITQLYSAYLLPLILYTIWGDGSYLLSALVTMKCESPRPPTSARWPHIRASLTKLTLQGVRLKETVVETVIKSPWLSLWRSRAPIESVKIAVQCL